MDSDSPSKQFRRVRRPDLDLPPQISIRGQLLTYTNGESWSCPSPDSKRGDIREFTDAARLRMTKRLVVIDYAKTRISVCVDLTYPDELIPRDKMERKNDLKQLLAWIERRLGEQVCGVWRTEWKARKTGKLKGHVAPHTHIILFGVYYIDWRELRREWQRILNHYGYIRTSVKRAGSVQKTCKYIGKYIRKRTDCSLVYAPYWHTVDGKHYGWVRPKRIPKCAVTWYSDPTAEEVEYLLRAHYEACPKSDTRPGESFSIIGESVLRIGKIIREMRLTAGAMFE